jgi:hypothetical protein
LTITLQDSGSITHNIHIPDSDESANARHFHAIRGVLQQLVSPAIANLVT